MIAPKKKKHYFVNSTPECIGKIKAEDIAGAILYGSPLHCTGEWRRILKKDSSLWNSIFCQCIS